MVRARSLSAHARAVLAILTEANADWSHGYDLGRRAGIKSGTLYPLLIRLDDLGYLESQWQAAPVSGRPARHVYRLTEAGRALARDLALLPTTATHLTARPA